MGLARATRLRVIGLCHGIGHAYRAAGEVLGIVAEEDHSRAAYEQIERRVDIKAAGLNHNTFVYAMRDAQTGADLYPEFLRRLRAMPDSYRPLARRMTDAFGLFPSLEDGHTGEYYAWAWETSPEQGYDFARAARHAEERRAWLQRAAAGQEPLDSLLAQPSGERAIPIVAACIHARNQYEVALNIPNRGSIAGLPEWAIVELPGVVGPAGVYGLQVPELPQAITAALAQQVAIQERAVTAALTGDRQAALQALLLDPTVWSYRAATAILDELLEAHAPFLPQFRR
jgi:alpha-galactosidase